VARCRHTTARAQPDKASFLPGPPAQGLYRGSKRPQEIAKGDSPNPNPNPNLTRLCVRIHFVLMDKASLLPGPPSEGIYRGSKCPQAVAKGDSPFHPY